MLVEDTMRTCAELLTVSRREETAEHRAQTYHSLVLRGKLWMAVRWIIEQEIGGVLQPGDRYTKTRDQVMEVLRAKHPETRTPTAASLESYPDLPPELTPMDITNDTVTAVMGRLLVEARPGGTNSVLLQH